MEVPPVSEVRVEFYVYPTEEEERVLEGLRRLLSGNVERSEKIFRSHHGYPIKLIKLKVSGEKAAASFLRIIRLLDERELDRVRGTLESRIEGRELYMRLDKQGLVEGRLDVNPDPVGGQVRVVVRFRRRVRPGPLGEWLAQVHRSQAGPV